jgi:hypothetical protein
MAITIGQVAIAQTAAASAVTLCIVPPGQCSVTITATGNTAYVGPTAPSTASSLLISNCYAVVPGAAPTSFLTFPNSKGTGLSVLSSSTAATATVSYIISTNA